MKNARRISTAMAALLGLLLTLISTGCFHQQIEARLQKAYLQGLAEGIELGRTEGYQLGYREGWKIGFDTGMIQGQKEGYKDGYGTGRDIGRQEGYEAGYETGYSAGLAVSELVRSMATGLLATYAVLAFLAGLALWFTSKRRPDNGMV